MDYWKIIGIVATVRKIILILYFYQWLLIMKIWISVVWMDKDVSSYYFSGKLQCSIKPDDLFHVFWMLSYHK